MSALTSYNGSHIPYTFPRLNASINANVDARCEWYKYINQCDMASFRCIISTCVQSLMTSMVFDTFPLKVFCFVQFNAIHAINVFLTNSPSLCPSRVLVDLSLPSSLLVQPLTGVPWCQCTSQSPPNTQSK